MLLSLDLAFKFDILVFFFAACFCFAHLRIVKEMTRFKLRHVDIS